MKRIAVFGNYAVGNLGDELMLEIILDHIRRQGHEPVVFCGVPQQLHIDHAVESHGFFTVGFRSWIKYCFSSSYRAQMKRAKEALASCQLVIFGGGGLFVDQQIRAVFLWRKQLQFALRLCPHVMLLSQNVSLQKASARFLCFPLLRRVDVLAVRDAISQEFLSRRGIKAHLLPDITFLKPPVRVLSEKSKKPLISIALRQTGLDAARMSALEKFFRHLSLSYDLQFLVFQSAVFDDRELYRRWDFSFPVISGRQVYPALEHSSFVIGMRYHALVFALQANVPFLALSYQPKVRSFAEDVQMQAFVVDCADISFSLLERRFDNLKNRQKELIRLLKEQNHQLTAVAHKYFDFF